MTLPFARRADPAVMRAMTRLDVLAPLRRQRARILWPTLACALLALGSSFLLPSQFLASTTFIPPPTPARALPEGSRSIDVADVHAGIGLSGDAYQYMALTQSALIADRLADRFKLDVVYGVHGRDATRRELARHTRIAGGRGDELITVSVEDTDPQRAAALANGYAAELGALIGRLAVGEAEQRREFFEELSRASAPQLAAAQEALARAGVDNGALQASVKAAARNYVAMQSILEEAELSLAALQSGLTWENPQVHAQAALVEALRQQLADSGGQPPAGATSHVLAYREFLYQQRLYGLFRRQADFARMETARLPPQVKVVDTAEAPEQRAWPRRGNLTIGAALIVFFGLSGLVLARHRFGGTYTPLPHGVA
jgi:uncharacterized protein involved in exopolysaccharide biosynthesis